MGRGDNALRCIREKHRAVGAFSVGLLDFVHFVVVHYKIIFIVQKYVSYYFVRILTEQYGLYDIFPKYRQPLVSVFQTDTT